MQGDQPDGLIEAATPGTPEAAAFDQALIDELDAADAEQVALQGPDAFTSARLLRKMAIVSELDPTRIGYAFASWCRARGWERSDLAAHLGVTPDQLAAMAVERRADPGYPLDAGVPQHDLASASAPMPIGSRKCWRDESTPA